MLGNVVALNSTGVGGIGMTADQGLTLANDANWTTGGGGPGQGEGGGSETNLAER